MYVERAADDEMCIYCRGMNIYLSFLYFCRSSLYKCDIKEKFGTFPTS